MRIELSPVRRADAPALIEANRQSQSLHLPWVHSFTDQAGFDAWFGATLGGAQVSLVARERATGAVAGLVNISQIFLKGFCSAYLGYYAMTGGAGRGLMAEALALAIRHGFDEIGLHRLEANIQPENQASIALVRRLGFRREGFSPRYLRIGGVWCDHERWALLADALDGAASAAPSPPP